MGYLNERHTPGNTASAVRRATKFRFHSSVLCTKKGGRRASLKEVRSECSLECWDSQVSDERSREPAVVGGGASANMNSRCADCSVLMLFSYPVPVCGLQNQMIHSLGSDLRFCNIGQVERVGLGLCGEAAPPGGGFVRCSPFSSSLLEACQSGIHSNFTWTPGLSARVLLEVSQVWLAGVRGGLDACRDQPPVTCDSTQAVILKGSCQIPHLMAPMANLSMLRPSFLRGANFTGFPEMRLPPPENEEVPFDTNNATAGPPLEMTTTRGTPTNATTQRTSLQTVTDATAFRNTTVVPDDATTLHSATATPNVSRSLTTSSRNNATTTLVPFRLNTTGTPAPLSASTVNIHAVATTTTTNATQTLRNATVLPTGADTTAIPGNSTLPATANHSATVLPNDTATLSVATAADRETSPTVPTTTAALDTQTYNRTETNGTVFETENLTAVNVTDSVTTETDTDGSHPSDTSIVNVTTTTTATISATTTTTITATTTTTAATTTATTTTPPAQSPPVNLTPPSMTGSDQHGTNADTRTPTTPLPTGHASHATATVAKVEGLVGRLERLLGGARVSQAVGRSAVRAISNLMEGDHQAISSSSNRLIRAVDRLALKLEVGEETLVLSASSLALAVRMLDGSRFPETSLSLTDTAHLQRSEGVLCSVFLPSSLLESLTPTEQDLASRVQFTFYTTPKLFQDVGLGNRTLVSPVLGSSVTNLSISNLRENIQFSIRGPYNTQADSLPRCVFWDFSLNVFLSGTLLTYLCFQKLLRDIPSKILVQLCLSLLLLNLLFLLDGWLALYPAPGLCVSTAFFLHYFLLTSFSGRGSRRCTCT
ncbi:hypothetical protein CRUP_035378 [Coryphaenoides rupestris]|nr:hypothetical protein CRUP_035378 [Coryphaenoides rupestris]